MASLDYNNYKVALIAPLEIEARAAMCMLDIQHTGRFPVRVGHGYNFNAGRMCGHNVVIGTFPLGQEYGIASAAALASQMKVLFPKLWFTLLVGVVAGLPSLKRDIRLGDVLVALPDGEVPAIVPYGLGKETSEGLNLLRGGRSQNQTQTIVGSAVGRIKVSDPEGHINGFLSRNILDHFKAMEDKRHSNGDFKDPGQPQDELIGTNTTGDRVVVPREPRPHNTARTRVWYGPLGSSDKLMKNAEKRDALRDQYNIIVLDMEAAGIMNRLAVGVIRGVCDYGDEQKKKEWQPHAAAMAAAYAIEVLKEISVVESDSYLHIRTPEEARYNEQPGSLSSKTQARMREPAVRETGLPPSPASSDIEMDSDNQSGGPRLRAQRQEELVAPKIVWPEIRNERPALASKFVKRKQFPSCLWTDSPLWDAEERQSPMKLLVHGVTGVGKSQICLQVITENESKFRAVFYVDASSRKSANNSYLAIARVSGTLIDTSGINSEEDISQQLPLTRFWISSLEEPWILFIDNFEPSLATDLNDYLPQKSCGAIVITTIDGHLAPYCDSQEIFSPMDPWDANELIHNFVNAAKDFSEDERVFAVGTLGAPSAAFECQKYSVAHTRSPWVKLAETERRLEIMLILANAYSSTGHFRDAKDVLEKAIEICDDHSIPDTWTLQVNEQPADCYIHTGEHEEALKYQPGVIQVYQQWGSGFDYLWSARINYAGSLWATEQRMEALSMAETALTMCGSHNLPVDDAKMTRVSAIAGERLRIFEAKSALGDSYDWDGQLLKSMSLRQKVYEARLELLGVDHPDTLHAFGRLIDTKSLLSHTQAEMEEVCDRRKDAVASRKRVRGEGHPHTNEARANLGHSYTAVSKFEEALSEQEDVLAFRNAKVTADAAGTDVYLVSVGNVADALWSVGRLEEAYSLLRDGLDEAHTMNYTMTDLDATFTLRSYLATFFSREGREDTLLEALRLRENLLRDRGSQFGEEDVRTHQTQLLLAIDLAKLGMYPQAIQVHEKLLERQRADPGEESQETLDNMKELASLLSSVSGAPQAAVLMDKLVGNGEHDGDDSDDEEGDNVPKVGSNRRDPTPAKATSSHDSPFPIPRLASGFQLRIRGPPEPRLKLSMERWDPNVEAGEEVNEGPNTNLVSIPQY
ncbi:hypothetical protein CSAL01_07868 [Colletotrichum salicis]|uniref:Nucleoside phosphorylase domain-containing protein n=1 Tax=Colletotrichum salicis TaxID=1209931 RepID=A0A135SYG9_9PEZI|nr:hypothetical protein CSAL01_07868 [Colletotrichum salicis]